jgi:transposase-like protein
MLLAQIQVIAAEGPRVVAFYSTAFEIGEVCRQFEVSEATYHRWKKQYDGAQWRR